MMHVAGRCRAARIRVVLGLVVPKTDFSYEISYALISCKMVPIEPRVVIIMKTTIGDMGS